MKDIAKDLGVSVVTVSKVLRNHEDIGSGTRARVLKRMKELNYRPNPAARALVTGRSFIIGLVVPDLVHSFFGEVAKGLSNALHQRGYSLVISSSEEDAEFEKEEIDRLLARRVDALIVASAQATGQGFERLKDQRMPYILIDRKLRGLAANFVGVDDRAVGTIATEHLIEVGCRKIAHIGGPEVSTALGRLAGYRSAMARHGMAMPSEYTITRERGDDSGDLSGYEAMKQLLKLRPHPDGVFCYNDPTAMGAMKAILEAGLSVPGDIAIVGCGNIRYADFLRVPLTSVDQNSRGIGDRAANLVLSLVESKSAPRPKSLLLEPKLIVRQSSARGTQ